MLARLVEAGRVPPAAAGRRRWGPFKRPPPRGAGGGLGGEGRELLEGLTPARARRRRRETTRSGRPRLDSWSRAPRVARTERCSPPGRTPTGPRGGAYPPKNRCVCGGGFLAASAQAAKRLLSAFARLLPLWEGGRERGRSVGGEEGAGGRAGGSAPTARGPGRSSGRTGGRGRVRRGSLRRSGRR